MPGVSGYPWEACSFFKRETEEELPGEQDKWGKRLGGEKGGGN